MKFLFYDHAFFLILVTCTFEIFYQSFHQLSTYGYLLNCMHKQQDFFGCLAEILGCLGLREAANLEIWPLRPRRGRKGQSSKVGSLEKALGQPKIEARPPKRSRCICIQYNRRFCCIFGQRFMPSHHQSLSSSVGRASGSYATALGSIPGFGIVFWLVRRRSLVNAEDLKS